MTTVNTDIDTITSDPTKITLSFGTEVEVQRLKTRQTFALMKILTAGLQGSIGSILFGEDTSEEEFASNVLGAMLLAIPDAQDETVEFVKSMVIPTKLIVDPKSKPEKESNLDAFNALYTELDNPELEDLVDIMEVVVKVEAPHIRALGKRLAVLFKAKSLSDTAKQATSSKRGSKS